MQLHTRPWLVRPSHERDVRERTRRDLRQRRQSRNRISAGDEENNLDRCGERVILPIGIFIIVDCRGEISALDAQQMKGRSRGIRQPEVLPAIG
jgi:hypothetical protein